MKYQTCEFTVVVDSREQNPFSFASLRVRKNGESVPLVVPMVCAGLKTGDYSVEGLESAVCIERKSKQDLYSTLAQATVDRAEHGAWEGRFVRELQRMKEFQFAAIVVEAGLASVLFEPPARTEFKPRSLLAVSLRLQRMFPNVHWVYCETRLLAEKWTFRALEMAWKDSVKQ